MTKYVILLTLLISTFLSASKGRAIVRRVIDKQGQQIISYSRSYALLIGVSDYTKGWPDLESIPSENLSF